MFAVVYATALQGWIYSTSALYGASGLLDVTLNLTYHPTYFQIVHGIAARVVPASNSQIDFGTPTTTHLEIYGGVLFAWSDATALVGYATIMMPMSAGAGHRKYFVGHAFKYVVFDKTNVVLPYNQ